jgi:thiamine-phosphate pyrophosphorylase
LPKRPSFPVLQAILDADASTAAGWEVSDLARAFLDGGATFIQLRAKQMPAGRFLELCDRIVMAAESYKATLIVNDRVDLAVMSGAGGAHVGQDDLQPKAARDLLGSERILGYSTHTVPQLRAALAQPISYVAIGPVFGTRSKETGYDPVGLELVGEAARLALDVPVVAIGGITLETAPRVLAAGASCVAVIGDLLATDDPKGRITAYGKALGL